MRCFFTLHVRLNTVADLVKVTLNGPLRFTGHQVVSGDRRTAGLIYEMITSSSSLVCSGDVDQLQEELVSLTDQRQTLTSDNQQLSGKVEHLQQE